MPTDLNQLSTLLGVEAHDPAALRIGLEHSPFSIPDLGMGAGRRRIGHFSHCTERIVPSWLTLTEEGSTTSAATYGLTVGGVMTMTTDDIAAKSDQWTTAAVFQPDHQVAGEPIIAEVKWKTGSTITASEYWVGLTDAAPDTDPIALSTTSTFTTSVPTDGIYMGYSATPTSGAAYTAAGNQHTIISIKGDANAIVATTGSTFVAATYYVYRFELAYDGSCKVYKDNVLLTTVTGLTTTVPYALMVCATPRTTVSAAISVDYIGISGAA